MAKVASLTIQRIDRYWAEFFGCPLAVLHTGQTFIGPHVGQGDYHGVFVRVRDASVLISVPPPLLHTLKPRLQHMDAVTALEPAHFHTLLGDWAERCVGPAFIGYADRATLPSVPRSIARLLTPQDLSALVQLQLACSVIEWEHGGSEIGPQPMAGVEVDNQLVAVAGYEIWGGDIAHIAVITHPHYRNGGYGRAVVHLIAAEALRHGLIPQYRTLSTNTPSMAIARSIGFLPYAYSMAVRFIS